MKVTVAVAVLVGERVVPVGVDVFSAAVVPEVGVFVTVPVPSPDNAAISVTVAGVSEAVGVSLGMLVRVAAMITGVSLGAVVAVGRDCKVCCTAADMVD